MKSLSCLFHGCQRLARTRGRCHSHYGKGAAQVKAGETTWAELEALGTAAPPRDRQEVRDELTRFMRRRP